MKKTLITLAALAVASVVQAADLTSWDSFVWESANLNDVCGDPGKTSAADGAYTMVITLNWDALTSAANSYDNRKKIANYYGNDSSNNIVMWKDGSSMTFALEVDDNHCYLGNGMTAGADATMGTYNYMMDTENYGFEVSDGNGGTVTQVAIAMSYDPDSTAVTIYGVKNNGTVGSAYSLDSSAPSAAFNKFSFPTEAGVVSKAYLFNDVLSTTQIADVASQAGLKAIPEPTTATLSLLALAGLAARRRRK